MAAGRTRRSERSGCPRLARQRTTACLSPGVTSLARLALRGAGAEGLNVLGVNTDFRPFRK